MEAAGQAGSDDVRARETAALVTGSARSVILGLLADRTDDASICPSEVARALGAENWREHMAVVHDTIDLLLQEGLVRLSWKGRTLPARAGPYRIRRAGSR
jgi:hypothetical protein